MATLLAVALVIAFLGPLLLEAVDPSPDPIPPQPVPSPPLSVEPPQTSPTPTPPEPPAPPPPYALPPMEWDPLPTPTFSDELWTQLQADVLLDESPAVLSGCPAPQTVWNRIDYEELVRQQWHCIHTAWVGVLGELGWSTVEPPLSFYEGEGAPSDCGYFEAPAFYCSADGGSVHFGTGHLEMTYSWDLSLNEMVNHEYGHHLQNLAGITTAKMQVGASNEVERRAELQATCWSAAMTVNNVDVDFDQDDWASWQDRLETVIVDGLHGSRESLLHWGTRGLYAETLGECNTWAVEATEVS